MRRENRKPKLGKNYARRSGGGFHKDKRQKRPQNQLFRQIEDEVDLFEQRTT